MITGLGAVGQWQISAGGLAVNKRVGFMWSSY